MLGKIMATLRALIETGITGRPWEPGSSDLAYSTGLPIAVCDAALRSFGDDLAPFVLDARRADITRTLDDLLTGSEEETVAAFAEFFDEPAPGCDVAGGKQEIAARFGPDEVELIERAIFTLTVHGRPFGAVFRSRADAVRVSWHLYRQASESEVSDDDAFAEYKRAMADARMTGPHVPWPLPDPLPRSGAGVGGRPSEPLRPTQRIRRSVPASDK